jgi:hypothetical protein
MRHVHGLFHPFEVRNFWEMVSIMYILTTKSAREVCPEVVVVLPLAFVVIVPLGVLVTLILVGFVGGYFHLILGYYCFSFFLSCWHYSTDEMDFPYSTIQKYEVVEWERAEQS